MSMFSQLLTVVPDTGGLFGGKLIFTGSRGEKVDNPLRKCFKIMCKQNQLIKF